MPNVKKKNLRIMLIMCRKKFAPVQSNDSIVRQKCKETYFFRGEIESNKTE